MKKKKQKKIPATKPIIIESPQPSRMQAITNLSLAILETAKALNTPAVVVRGNQFIGAKGTPSLSIITRRNDGEHEKR